MSLIFLLCLIASCRQTAAPKPQEVQAYYNSFLSDAIKRNHPIANQPENWNFEFGDLDDQKAGKCLPNATPKIIVVDSLLWKRSDSLQRKTLLYHEFGHCFLNREHRNEKLPFGECVSLMDGSENGFYCSNNIYSEKWWEYYIDELFDPEVKIPDWYREIELGNLKTTDRQIFRDTCLGAANNLKICHYDINYPVEESICFLVRIYLDSAWEHSEIVSIFLHNMKIQINTSESLLKIVKTNTFLMQLEAYYYRNKFNNLTDKDKLEFSILTDSEWMYFFINKKQFHLTESMDSLKEMRIRSYQVGTVIDSIVIEEVVDY